MCFKKACPSLCSQDTMNQGVTSARPFHHNIPPLHRPEGVDSRTYYGLRLLLPSKNRRSPSKLTYLSIAMTMGFFKFIFYLLLLSYGSFWSVPIPIILLLLLPVLYMSDLKQGCQGPSMPRRLFLMWYFYSFISHACHSFIFGFLCAV